MDLSRNHRQKRTIRRPKANVQSSSGQEANAAALSVESGTANKRRQVLMLLPYQRQWVEDNTTLKIVVKARQVGYSFAATLRAVLTCLERKTTWIFLSKGERQSRLLMEKVQEHVRAIGVVARYVESGFVEGTLTKQLETRFPNGSVIYGLPANPDTARGYTGNVTLDEFAFHQDAAKVYSALYPTVTRGFSIEVVSTPNGQRGKYYELAKAAGLVGKGWKSGISNLKSTNGWSGHRTDIYQAVDQGLQINLDELHAGCDDEETWLQEYCCEFLSDAQNYIPMELIAGCISERAATECEISELKSKELYLGVDIGRKRDLTVVWLFEKLGDVLWSRVLKCLRGASFEVQEKMICDLLDYGVSRCCVDQSGMGMMLAERLEKKYGAIVEPVQFTQQLKEYLAPLVKQAFEGRLVRIPDNREARADLNAVKRYVTPAGNVRFDAEHTDKGHADRFWALALALNAASTPAVHFTEAGALVGQPLTTGLGERVL